MKTCPTCPSPGKCKAAGKCLKQVKSDKPKMNMGGYVNAASSAKKAAPALMKGGYVNKGLGAKKKMVKKK